MHIAVSVRDFKAIVLHAETLKASVQARYSFPTRPLQLVYNEHGMQCEFTLMTIGDYRGSSTTPIPVSSRNSPALPQDSRPPRPSSTQETQASITRANDKDSAAMAPPSQPASRSFQQFPQTKSPNRSLPRKELNQKLSKPSPPPPKASLDPESLFLPADTDDKQWDEANYEEEETLGWDASASSVSELQVIFRRSHCLHIGGSITITQDAGEFEHLALSIRAGMARRYRPTYSPNSTPGRCGCMAMIPLKSFKTKTDVLAGRATVS